MELLFEVENQYISRVNYYKPVSGSQNYLTARFAFKTSEWVGTKTALFKSKNGNYEMLLTGDSCVIPWEVLACEQFEVSVFCGDLITANSVVIKQEQTAYVPGETPEPPTESVYAQIIEKLDEIVHGGVSISADDGNIIELRADGIYAHAEGGGEGGKYIASITERTSTESGGTNYLDVEYSDGSGDTFTVRNGADGKTPVKGIDYKDGNDGIPCTHRWEGTRLVVTSASGTSSADLKGEAGDSYTITAEDYNAIADVVLGKLVSAETQEV